MVSTDHFTTRFALHWRDLVRDSSIIYADMVFMLNHSIALLRNVQGERVLKRMELRGCENRCAIGSWVEAVGDEGGASIDSASSGL